MVVSSHGCYPRSSWLCWSDLAQGLAKPIVSSIVTMIFKIRERTVLLECTFWGEQHDTITWATPPVIRSCHLNKCHLAATIISLCTSKNVSKPPNNNRSIENNVCFLSSFLPYISYRGGKKAAKTTTSTTTTANFIKSVKQKNNLLPRDSSSQRISKESVTLIKHMLH